MSDQKMIEIAWNVLSGDPKEFTVVALPMHPLATPGKRSVRLYQDRFAHYICPICRRNPHLAHTLSSFAAIMRDKGLTRRTLSGINPNYIEELHMQGYCDGIHTANGYVHQYAQLSFGELTTGKCRDCSGQIGNQLTHGRGAIASIYLERS
jgi:hypothetical protein